MRHRELLADAGSAELECHHRLARTLRRGGELGQPVGVADRLQEQQEDVRLRVVDTCQLDLADGQIRLVTDPDRLREPQPQQLRPRDQPAHHRAALRQERDDPAGKLLRLGVDRIGGDPGAAVQVGQPHRIGAKEPHSRRPRGLDQGSLHRRALRPGLGEAVGQHGGDLDPDRGAFGDRLRRQPGADQNVNMLRHLRQVSQGGIGPYALHLVAARVDDIDGAAEACPAQVVQRLPRRPPGVAGEPHQPDAARPEQGLAQGGAVRCFAAVTHAAPLSLRCLGDIAYAIAAACETVLRIINVI